MGTETYLFYSFQMLLFHIDKAPQRWGRKPSTWLFLCYITII